MNSVIEEKQKTDRAPNFSSASMFRILRHPLPSFLPRRWQIHPQNLWNIRFNSSVASPSNSAAVSKNIIPEILNTVWLDRLPPYVGPSEIERLIQRHGVTGCMELYTLPHGGSRRFARVDFERHEDAVWFASYVRNRRLHFGRRAVITLGMAESQAEKRAREKKLKIWAEERAQDLKKTKMNKKLRMKRKRQALLEKQRKAEGKKEEEPNKIDFYASTDVPSGQVGVRFVPFLATRDDVKVHFEELGGPVKQIKMLRAKSHRRFGLVIVEFEEVASAIKAVGSWSVMMGSVLNVQHTVYQVFDEKRWQARYTVVRFHAEGPLRPVREWLENDENIKHLYAKELKYCVKKPDVWGTAEFRCTTDALTFHEYVATYYPSPMLHCDMPTRKDNCFKQLDWPMNQSPAGPMNGRARKYDKEIWGKQVREPQWGSRWDPKRQMHVTFNLPSPAPGPSGTPYASRWKEQNVI